MEVPFRDLVEQHNRCYDAPPPALSYGSTRSSEISSSSSAHSSTTSPAMRDWAKDPSLEIPPISSLTPAAISLPSPASATSSTSVGNMTASSRTVSLAGLSSSTYSSPPASPSLYTSINNNGSNTALSPPNFGVVATDVYRSSFPRNEHFPYLRSLGLRTVLTLVLEDYPEENRAFLEAEGIELIQLGMPNNKDPRAQIPGDTIRKALAVVLDRRKHPLLIHCNRGKHRTGCLIGCLRRMQRWPCQASLDEYRRYAHPKERLSDQDFITAFACDEAWRCLDVDGLPDWIDQTATIDCVEQLSITSASLQLCEKV